MRGLVPAPRRRTTGRAAARSGADEEQEYRLSPERDRRGSGTPRTLARGSWNAGEAKRCLDLASRWVSPKLRDGGGRLADEGGYLRRVGRVRRGIRASPRAAMSLDVGDPFEPDARFAASVEGVRRAVPGFPESLKLLRLEGSSSRRLTHQLRREIFQHGKVHHVAGAEHAGGRVMSEGNATAGNATARCPPRASPNDVGGRSRRLAPRGSIPEGGLGALRVSSVPAGGESFLLMHARWKKLEQDIYHPARAGSTSRRFRTCTTRRSTRDHNSHLELDGLEELYRVSRCLAEGVVPNEYGTHPQEQAAHRRYHRALAPAEAHAGHVHDGARSPSASPRPPGPPSSHAGAGSPRPRPARRRRRRRRLGREPDPGRRGGEHGARAAAK